MIRAWVRISIVAGVGILGAISQGAAGAFYSLMLLGLGLFVWQLATNAVQGILRAVRRPSVRIDNKTLNLTVEEQAIKGTSANSDPTRPTTDDFMGIIEQRKH